MQSKLFTLHWYTVKRSVLFVMQTHFMDCNSYRVVPLNYEIGLI